MRVADNPHKPGTDEHRAWEMDNIHMPRGPWHGRQEYADAKAVADARLAALKANLAHVDTRVDDLLAYIAAPTEVEPSPTAVAVVVTSTASGYVTVNLAADASAFRSAIDGLRLSMQAAAPVFQRAIDALCRLEHAAHGRRLLARKRNRRGHR